MRFIKDGLTVYCFTDQRTRKYQQIKANKNVAVAADSLSIEGGASLTGSPMDPENAQCLDVFRKTLPDWYETWEKWGHFDNSNVKVIKVTPKRITLFKMKEFSDVPESYFALLDPVKKKAYKLDSSEYVETQVYKNK